MANEQRTVRPQCTGVAVTAGGGEGGGRPGEGAGWAGLGWAGGARGPGKGPAARACGRGCGRGKEAGGGRRAGLARGRGLGAGPARPGQTAGGCQGPPRRLAPGRTVPGSRHDFTWDSRRNCAGNARQPWHLLRGGWPCPRK